MYVLGECRLQSDDNIVSNFGSNTPESVFRSGGEIIYNNAPEPDFGDINNSLRGDVFVRKISSPIRNKKDKIIRYFDFNHYGLYFNNNRNVIDENWRSDGRVRFGSDTENFCTPETPCGIRYQDSRWKIGRPQ